MIYPTLYLSLALTFISLAAPKPNIVFILVDDLGWQDVKCYDIDEPSPIETPHLDALAKRGIQFWQGYSPAPTCAPSRCAIMSGIHPARAQKTHVVGGDLPLPRETSHPMIEPWYSGRILQNTPSLAQTLKNDGYATGHTGKWHIARHHYDQPQPQDLGFDFTTHVKGQDIRGVQTRMRNRLKDFSTTDPSSPYPLDAEGFPTDPITEQSLTFMEEHKARPFFLYNATWLVHTPIQARSRELLEKYCGILNTPIPTDPEAKYTAEGQINPYYCAMVETLDHYVGKLVQYLDQTDDPRNPGHKLSANTYLIFTSDNGGMEGNQAKGMITDNFPLDRGKLSAKEGGTRVPFLIAGPHIPQGTQSHVPINALDLYPTILQWTQSPHSGLPLDGSDLSTFLKDGAQNGDLILLPNNEVRTHMVWHYPHPSHSCSTLRSGGYKLILNYGAEFNEQLTETELYRLYDAQNQRVDIEEQQDLSSQHPEVTHQLKAKLLAELDAMQATRPYKNPLSPATGELRSHIPSLKHHKIVDQTLTVTLEQPRSKANRVFLYYTQPSISDSEEWFRTPMQLNASQAQCQIPSGAHLGFVAVVDQNQFLSLYPEVPERSLRKKRPLSDFAILLSQ